MDSLLAKTTALRGEAWDALKASPHFAAFKALDDAVVALGGKSEIPMSPAPEASPDAQRVKPVVLVDARRRLSQADTAEAVLRDAGEPLHIGSLFQAALLKGVKAGGENQLSNFRSALSKDKRFRSIMRNGQYFWWFTASPVPQKWNEAPDLPLQNGSDASVSHSSQEGGESHEATTTH